MSISVEHPTNQPNFSIVWSDHVSVAFSYKTAIAFNEMDGRGWVCRENVWGPTTGKHLNYLDKDHSSRLPESVWERKYREANEKVGA